MQSKKEAKRIVKGFVNKFLIFSSVLLLSTLIFGIYKAMAATTSNSAYGDPRVIGYAFIAAALSTGLAALAAGIAVGYTGAAAIGVIGEKPEAAGRTLIFVGLAEGIAIYGLIIAIMILGKIPS